MSRFGKFLRRTSDGYAHWCPGCESVHVYSVPRWTFNDNLDLPSFTPSMLLFVTLTEDDQGQKLPKPIRRSICHYVITNGKILFCADCEHTLAGKTVGLPVWPYPPGEYGGVED